MEAVDPEALARDAARLVQTPSVTGDEQQALAVLAEIADAAGLDVDLHEHDLPALRGHPGHPGEEAPRERLFGVTATLPGTRPGRIALNGHVDVVWAGTEPWRHGPWSGAIVGGRLHGRGAVDMKGPLIAALHALKALQGTEHPEVVLMGVPSEEDGGLGTFAELERDDAFDAALLPEPTGLRVVCAQAGALTFKGVVTGKAAHAAERLAGVSAIDRYVPVHEALHAHERDINAEVAHPLMRALELPYPVLVGRIAAGEWSSMVPDRLGFEGRPRGPAGADLQEARDALQRTVGDDVELEWSGGAFAPGETDPDHPWPRTVRRALGEELGREAPVAGVPWGADMRLFTARGIPTVMVGTHDIELAHAVDESVSIEQLALVAGTIVRALSAPPPAP